MKLEDLKYFMDALYGFNIAEHTRKRKYAYARKVFITLAKNYGYAWKEITPVIEQKHDLCIYHYNTFNTIRPIDLEKYNACISYFNLNMEKIPSMAWFTNGERIMGIIHKLKGLSGKNLKYFESNKLDKFLVDIEKEKEIKELYNKLPS